jgi:hypothetical protein
MTDSERWEAVGRKLLATEVEHYGENVREAFVGAADELYQGEGPTAEQVHAIRRSIEEAQYFVEEYAAPLADDVEPWDGAVDRVPVGTINEALGR